MERIVVKCVNVKMEQHVIHTVGNVNARLAGSGNFATNLVQRELTAIIVKTTVHVKMVELVTKCLENANVIQDLWDFCKYKVQIRQCRRYTRTGPHAIVIIYQK